jgi:hypothetical protein
MKSMFPKKAKTVIGLAFVGSVLVACVACLAFVNWRPRKDEVDKLANVSKTPGTAMDYSGELLATQKRGLAAKTATWKTSIYHQYKSKNGERSKWVPQ